MTDIRTFDLKRFDPKDPDPWLALYLDQSLPIDETAKQALLIGNRSISRRWLFPVARVFIFGFFIVVKILRGLSPRRPNMNVALHRFIHWGLKNFASPEANMLILRHFTLATELLAFIKANAGPVEIDSWPLRPTRLADLRDNVFLQHDLNIYNFIIQLNAGLRAQGRDLMPVQQPDFSAITDGPIALEPLPAGPLNVIDVQTAIEAYTPMYALFLPREDFVRAANSLQLDEIIHRDLHRENPRHRLSPGLHEERPSAGAALDPAGGLSADDARPRRRRAARLVACAQTPAGRGASARPAQPDGCGRHDLVSRRQRVISGRLGMRGPPANRVVPSYGCQRPRADINRLDDATSRPRHQPSSTAAA